MPTAVEEFLRAYAPVTMARFVAEDTTSTAPMKPGEWVLLPFPAANRDPEAFRRRRGRHRPAENRHAAFGLGIHRCLGSNPWRGFAPRRPLHRHEVVDVDPSEHHAHTDGRRRVRVGVVAWVDEVDRPGRECDLTPPGGIDVPHPVGVTAVGHREHVVAARRNMLTGVW